jgi:hypothetical protein
MTKKMLQLSLKKCPSCGRTVLEAALDDYGGRADRKCDRCSGLYSQIIGFWVEFLRRALGFKRAKVEKLLTDRYARNAVLNLVESFAYFGIKKPMSLSAPFLVVWDFTHKCNLQCKHCYSNSGAVEEDEVTTEQALAVVDQLADAHVTALALVAANLSRARTSSKWRGMHLTVDSTFRWHPTERCSQKRMYRKSKKQKLTTST